MSYCIIYIDRIDGIGKIKQFLLISLEVCKKKMFSLLPMKALSISLEINNMIRKIYIQFLVVLFTIAKRMMHLIT